MEVLPDQQPDSADRAASAAEDDGFLSRIGKAAENLVGGSGSNRAKPEVVSAGLAVQEKPPPAKKWPPQKRVEELTGKRTANGKVYQLSDGRTQAEISMVPLHYRDANGKFQTIDTRVRPVKDKGYVQGNRTNSFTSLFGDSSDELVRFEQGGRSIELGLEGAARGVTPTVSGSRVTYAGVAGGADVVYDVTSTALKEKIVLRRAPSGPVSYTFTLDTAGLTAQQREDGSIAFVRMGGGEPVFVMPAPFFWLADRSVDADQWPVIARKDPLESWHRFDVSTTEFVYRLLADPEFTPFTVADPPRRAFYLPAGQTISSAEEWDALASPNRQS
ncbi:hypothetical protein ACLQ28_18535 [Micromonospora sp. DT201]|uniref:hypothetical protein n=1 Tax=Micromonospora sp. DT201 TaxID=3393442 RepID=UPI003CF68D7E